VAGRLLRNLLKKWWDGPVALDNALRCKMPKGKKPTETMVKRCRPYLAQTIRDAAPTRIITMGSVAGKAVTGRAVNPFSIRRGYTWLTDPLVPVFLMMNPAAASRNRFVEEWFKGDLKFALTADTRELRSQIPWDGCAKIVRTKDDVLDAHEEALGNPWNMYDTETAGRMFEDGSNGVQPAFRLLCVSMCGPTSEDVWMWDKQSLEDPVCFAGLKRIMEDRRVKMAAHNEVFDRNAMHHVGIRVRGYAFDTQLTRKIQDPEVLKRLEYQQELVGMGGGKEEMKKAKESVVKTCRVKPTKKRTERDCADMRRELGDQDLVEAIRNGIGENNAYVFGLVPEELLLRYNGIDSLSAARLGGLIEDRFANGSPRLRQVRRVWDELIHPASDALAQVQRWGVAADRDQIEVFQHYVQTKFDNAAERIRKMAGDDFDAGNRHHLIDLLYTKLKLPVLAKTKTTGDPATDAKTLKKLAHRHEIIEDILLFKKVTKSKGTYADAYLAHIRADGRMHPSLNLDGAATGRTSMENPNLQQVPRTGTVEGKMARDCFSVADIAKYVMVSFDFSQLEYRVAADLSGDPEMLHIYKSDLAADLHMRTAQLVSQQVWGIAPEDVTKDHRSEAKAINFGTLYGMGDYALAAILGRTPDEARAVKKAIMGRFKVLDAWCKAKLKEARLQGGVWTDWAGEPFRFRPLWRVADRDDEARSRAEHGSWNTPVQGKASDYCLFSLAECVKWLVEDAVPAKLVLTVHDSLIFEVRKDALNEVLATVPEIMTSWPVNNGVPLLVDAEVGPSWGSLEKV
jgi:uracil-DNA glycosylase family 4